MRIEILNEFPDAQEWRAQWERLLANAGSDDAFLTSEWVRAAAEYDRDARLMLVCGYAQSETGERLTGVAPLAWRKRRVAGLWRSGLEFMSGQWGDYNDLICEPQHLERFVYELAFMIERLISDRSRPCSHVYLHNLPNSTATADLLTDACSRQGLQVNMHQTDVGPALQYSGSDPKEVAALLKKKNVVQKLKALARRGTIEFAIERDLARQLPLLQHFYRMHTARYLINGQLSIYDPDNPAGLHRLLDRLTELLSSSGGVWVPVIYLNGRPVALSFCLVHRNVCTQYALTFDVGILGSSPGEILTHELSKYCHQAGIDRLDFGAGDESYKYRFTNAERVTYGMMIHRGELPFLISEAAMKVRTVIRSNAELRNRLRDIRTVSHQIGLEAVRTGRFRAIRSFLRKDTRDTFHIRTQTEAKGEHLVDRMLGISPEEIVDVILRYRNDLPAWDFAALYAALRQGQICYLDVRDGHLRRIYCLPESDHHQRPVEPRAGTSEQQESMAAAEPLVLQATAVSSTDAGS